ncbi:MAG: hypothetical protein K6G06_05845 [Butyrivibrio sp.]|nr:hypothetical protein [Butyrivibrio sp.]
MDINYILEQSGIPLLLTAIAIYYAVRLLVFKDYETVRGRGKDAPKDIDAYCKNAGLVIIFFAISTLVMAVLVLFNPVIGFAQILICTIIMVVLWKKLTDKYS